MVSFTWDVVDAVVGMLRDSLVADVAGKQRFNDAYSAIKQRVAGMVKWRAFDRAVLASALYYMVYNGVNTPAVTPADLASVANSLDLSRVAGGKLKHSWTPGAITRAVNLVKRLLCTHPSRATRTSVCIDDDPSMPDTEFLAAARTAKVEVYCTECLDVSATKAIPFTCSSILATIRAMDRKGDGVLVKDLIARLKRDYIVCTRQNADPRKQQASEYMALKGVLRPFIRRGLITVEGKARCKRVQVNTLETPIRRY